MLKFAARHGRWCLVIGLLFGLTLPGLAEALRPHLPVMIAALLFLAAFRIGPEAIWNSIRSDFGDIGLIVVLQIVVPLLLLGGAHLLSVGGTTVALAAVLLFSAPSVTGSANFALLMNVRPEAALRLLMVGTALFPITVLPVLLFIPELETATVLSASVRLVATVLLAGGVALFLRRGRFKTLSLSQEKNLDGASAILLGVVVIGLMSAVGPMLRSTPMDFAIWLGFATLLNFSAQLLAWHTMARTRFAKERAAISIVAGNRNIALFLIALPPETTLGLLSFIGCYQIPMYLTPILFRRIYRD